MSGDSEVEKPSTPYAGVKRPAEELCRKAKETLDKANSVLANSGKKVRVEKENKKKGETS